MNNTGMIRRVDELGRLVIPIEIRNRFDIKEKDPMEIYVQDDLIILKKYEANCLLCGETKDLVEFNSKVICKKCIQELQKT
mgnify:CR=1 FL=1